jgi:hypothetical protein
MKRCKESDGPKHEQSLNQERKSNNTMGSTESGHTNDSVVEQLKCSTRPGCCILTEQDA